MVGENFDATNGGQPKPADSEPTSPKKFIGIQFSCCSVYARVYVNAERTAYRGHCPRCARPLTIKISPDGTDDRFFTVR